MDQKLIKVLSRIQLFSSLTVEDLEHVAQHVQLRHLKKDEILFEQGSPPHAVYILTKGELVGYLLKAGQEITINIMAPPEIIGELGVLSKEPRSLTIKALIDADLIELSATEFTNLMQRYPKLLYELMFVMINRIQGTMSELTRTVNWNFMIADGNLPRISDFKQGLKKEFEKDKNIAFIEASELPADQPNKWINDLEKKVYHIIIWLDAECAELALKFYRLTKAKIYFIVDALNASYTFCTIQTIYDQLKNHPIKYLVLLHPAQTEIPKNTIFWLNNYQIKQHYHVRIGNEADHARLAHFISEQACGIVLSGGGTKVLAHAGFLQALYSKKVVIDAVGGTSSGGLLGALYLLKQFDVSMKNLFHDQHLAYKTFSYRELTWPIISLFSGASITTLLQRIYGDATIEDLWLPFFCISSNLSSYQETVHNRGKLWEIVRASVAIPGVLPPVILNNELHMDGGIINNLPVDVMKEMCGFRGFVVASFLKPVERQSKHVYNFPPIVSLKDVLLRKLRLSQQKYFFPNYIDLLLKSLLLGANTRQVANSHLADILVNPDLAQYGFLSKFTEDEEEALVQKGYDTTLQQIEKHFELFGTLDQTGFIRFKKQ